MALENKFDIERFLSLEGYDTEVRKSRRKTGVSSNEFFTPYSIVKRMCDKVNDEDWADPKKTFLEPSCGNGQFVIYMIWNRLQHGVDWKTALKTCYSVELMQDNVDEMFGRIDEMLSQLCEDYDKEEGRKIMEEHFVCHDFFTWNFEEWRPMTEEEIKTIKKRK